MNFVSGPGLPVGLGEGGMLTPSAPDTQARVSVNAGHVVGLI